MVLVFKLAPLQEKRRSKMIDITAAQRLFNLEKDLNTSIVVAIGESGSKSFVTIAKIGWLRNVPPDLLRIQLELLEQWGFIVSHKSLVTEVGYYVLLIFRGVLSALGVFGSAKVSKSTSPDKQDHTFIKDDIVYSLTALGQTKLTKHNSARN